MKPITKQSIRNVIASLEMEGFDFTDEQLESLADLIEQVDTDKMTWQETIDLIIQKYRKG